MEASLKASQNDATWHPETTTPRGRRPLARTVLTLLSAVALLPAMLLVAPATPAQAAVATDCAVPGPPGWAAAEHPGMITDYPDRWRDPVGTHQAIALFVDFYDAVGTPTERQSLVDNLAPATDWFDISSYGQTTLNVTWDTQWRRMPQPSGYYHDYDPNRSVIDTFALHRRFMQDAVTAADPQVDFTGYDFVYVIVPPALFNANYRSAAIIIHANNTMDHLSTDEGSIRLGASLGWGLEQYHRLLVHETGHLFGLPDLYSYTIPGDAGHAFVGGWDLMGDIWGAAPDHFAWHKWKMGWLDDSQVHCMDTNSQATWTLTPLHTTGGSTMGVVRTGHHQAVVVEYRADGGPIDGHPEHSHMPHCFRPGVLVYTIDADKVGGQGPIQVLDANPWSDSGPDCSPRTRQLDDATLVYPYQTVTDPQSGVQVTLTGIGSDSRTVQVTWP